LSKKIFNTPKEVFEEQINDIFGSSSIDNSTLLIKILNLSMYSSLKNKDVINLYNELDFDNFITVLALFEGRTLAFPTKEEIKEALITSLVYYYREIKNYSWEEIKEIFPFEFSSISYSMKSKKLNDFIKTGIQKIIKEEGNNG